MEICHILSGYIHLVLCGHIFPPHKCNSTYQVLNPILKKALFQIAVLTSQTSYITFLWVFSFNRQ